MSAAVVDLFRYQDAEVRVVVIDDEPWFVAADVASILDYRMASDMTRSLDPLDRGTRLMRTPSGPQDMAVNDRGDLTVRYPTSRPVVLADELRDWLESQPSERPKPPA